MNVLQSEAYLREPVEHVLLGPVIELAAILVFLLVLLLDATLQVATVGVVHDDAQLALLRLVDFLEAHNVWVAQNFKDLCLSKSVSALVLVHLLDVNLLDDGVALVRLALDEVGGAEGADAERLHFLVGFVSFLGCSVFFLRFVI